MIENIFLESVFASDVWKLGIILLSTFLVGLLGGYVGLALGTIRLPILLFLGMPANIAAGTNILVSSLASLAGAITHWGDRRVNWSVVWKVGLASFIGGFVGAVGAHLVYEGLLISIVGILVFWQGIEFYGMYVKFRDSEKNNNAREMTSNSEYTNFRMASATLMGLVVGLIGGAVGLILGTLRLPLLIKLLRMPPHIAAGTNMFIGTTLGITGWVGHVTQSNVDYFVLVPMAIAGMIGSFIGAKFTGKAKVSRLCFVLFVVLMISGVLLLWRGFNMLF